jgi:prevent-host-death family protein
MTIMTTMTKLHSRDVASDGIWSVAQAKANFSELIEKAQSEGPQMIAKHGREAAVIVSAEEWRRKTKRQGTLAEFLLASPLHGSGVEIKRLPGRLRKVDL